MPLGCVQPLGMRSLSRLLLWVLLVASSGAWADQCTQYRYGLFGVFGEWLPTPEDACESANGVTFVPYGATQAVLSNVVKSGVGTCLGTQTVITNCSTGCTSPRSFGYVSRTGDYCEPDVCAEKSGQSMTVNGTFGWSLENRGDPDATWWDSKGVGDFSYSQVGSKSCVDGCEVGVVSLDQAYQSKERHANGMFRWSIDYGTMFTGQACEPSGSPAHMMPGTAEPSCPGAVGEVNGQRVCVPGSGHAPSNAASAVAVAGDVPVTSGNPSAGEKPSTGPGSGEGGVGRTPLVGNGGNAGGSSSAAGGDLPTGPPGDGTPGDPYRPKDPCGLPGTPPCKLDERGTPTSGDYSGAHSAFDAAAASEIGLIEGAGSVNALSWVWGFTVPQGVCSELSGSIAGRPWSIDICSSPLVAIWRAALGWLFAGLSALYIWRRATNSA